MTDESHETTEKPRSKWIEDAEEALEGVGEALKAAWDQSRDARLTALESAKSAAKQLGEAIDQGMTAARQRWDSAPTEADESVADAAKVGDTWAKEGGEPTEAPAADSNSGTKSSSSEEE